MKGEIIIIQRRHEDKRGVFIRCKQTTMDLQVVFKVFKKVRYPIHWECTFFEIFDAIISFRKRKPARNI